MHTSTPITLALGLFDDLLGLGLRVVIESDPSIVVVADEVDHDRVEVILRAHHPRVALLDVEALPSLAAVRELSRQHPGTRLVLLSRDPTTAECAQLLAFGASACLGMDTQARDVLSAIHLASRGLQLIPRGSRDSGAAAPPGSELLTQREVDVLPMLQRGSSNAQIAAELHIGVETVRSHARNIYRKLGVASRRDLGVPRAPAADPAADLAAAATASTARHGTPPPHGRQRRPGSLRR